MKKFLTLGFVALAAVAFSAGCAKKETTSTTETTTQTEAPAVVEETGTAASTATTTTETTNDHHDGHRDGARPDPREVTSPDSSSARPPYGGLAFGPPLRESAAAR